MKHIRNKDKLFPTELNNIPDPPKELFIESNNWQDLLESPKLAVIGSRKASSYGQVVTEKLVRGIVAKGVVIVSGLALGIDSLAHKAALNAGGKTIAVLPSGLDEIYPKGHLGLARQIIKDGGALVSEYSPKTMPFKYNFIARNRIISGISKAVLITEAAINSGSLHTANFALEQGKDVLVVPGPITSATSAGCNNLIKNGATPITSVDDILEVLNISGNAHAKNQIFASNSAEYQILQSLSTEDLYIDELHSRSKLDTAIFQQTISYLEITGRIKAVGGNIWTLL